jgi:hypothetical protein
VGLDSSDLAKSRLATSSISAEQGITDHYAWAVSPGFFHLPLPFYGHDGGIDGFISYYGYQPETKSGFAISINCMESAARITRLIAYYLTQEEPKTTPAIQKMPEPLKKALTSLNGSFKKLNPRNELFRSSDLMFSSLDFRFDRDTLFVSQLFGDPEAYTYAGGTSFAKVGHCCPSIHLIKGEDDKYVYQFDNYYGKEALPWSLFWRLIFFAGFLVGMVLAVFGVIWCIMLVMKGIPLNEFRERMIPVLALASFMGLLFGISMAFGDLIETASVNPLTLSIFICSLAFPVFSFLGTFIWGKRLIKKEFSFNSIFLFISSLIMALFSSLLIGTGIFGLMIWNG